MTESAEAFSSQGTAPVPMPRYRERMVVGDADNSRLVDLRHGRAVSVIGGLNNPTMVVIVPGT